jgi:uncharacterized membrane protein YbhN (UPF0104 family)
MQEGFEKLKSLTDRQGFKRAVVAVGMGLALLIIGSIVWRNWSEFQTFSWQLNPVPLAGAALALVAAFGLNVLAWVLISRAFGGHVGFWKDLEIYSYSTVIRRLPGAIWQVAGRTYLYRQAATTLAVPLWGSFWELIVQLASAMLLLTLMLMLSPVMRNEFPGGAWWFLFWVPIGWFIIRPRDIVSLAQRISPKVHNQPSLTTRNASLWVGLYVLSWIAGGAILYFLVSSLAPQNWELFPVCVGLVAASGVLAILAGPIPGGLGIREASLVLLLDLYVSIPVAVAGAVLFRLWILVGEALIAFVVFLVAKRVGSGQRGPRSLDSNMDEAPVAPDDVLQLPPDRHA